MTHEKLTNDALELLRLRWSLLRRSTEAEIKLNTLNRELAAVESKLARMSPAVVTAADGEFTRELRRETVGSV
jgi:hypothetical protein